MSQVPLPDETVDKAGKLVYTDWCYKKGITAITKENVQAASQASVICREVYYVCVD